MRRAVSGVLFGALLLLSVFAMTPAAHEGDYECIVDQILQHARPPREVDIGTSAHMAKRAVGSAGAPIRILFDYTYLNVTTDRNHTCGSVGQQVIDKNGRNYTCLSTDVLTRSHVNLIINTIIPEATRRLQTFLNITDPVVGLLQLPADSCSAYDNTQPTPIPAHYTSTGVVNTDLVVFVTGRPVPRDCALRNASGAFPSGCPTGYTVIAFAGQCYEDSFNKRPLAGYFNFNPGLLEATASDVREKTYATSLHELTHVLGFTNFKLANRLWDAGHVPPRVRPTSEVFRNSTINPAWSLVVLPTVVTVVKDHFGCIGTMRGGDGALLEPFGSGATAGSHWSRMVYHNEYMTGVSNEAPAVSKLTLALLADMGWYTVNISYGKTLMYGYKQGCNFGSGNCTDQPAVAPYRCTSATASSCNADRTAKAHCENPVTSVDPLTGTCPLFEGWQNGYCNYKTDQSLLVSSDSGESWGPNSRCFDSNLATDSPTGADPNFGCYEILCSSGARLKLKIDGLHYNCPITSSSATQITPIGYNGKITCPTDTLLCLGAATLFWPEVTGVQPDRPTPGDKITVIGYNFTANMTISIVTDCTDPTFVSPTEYTCTLADWSVFSDPTQFKNGINLIMRDSQGRTAVRQNIFDVPASDAILTALAWIRAYPLYTGLIAALIFIILVLLIVCACCYCCKKQKQKKRVHSEHSTRVQTADA